ncbi:MAG: phospholipase effector Tle1 domain-containing protein, partial [Bradyrhizobium sp.]
MKRIVILVDGTWNEEGNGINTNIAKLDPKNRPAGAPLIKEEGADGTRQLVFYHDGVGNDPELLKHLLGGAIGI